MAGEPQRWPSGLMWSQRRSGTVFPFCSCNFCCRTLGSDERSFSASYREFPGKILKRPGIEFKFLRILMADKTEPQCRSTPSPRPAKSAGGENQPGRVAEDDIQDFIERLAGGARRDSVQRRKFTP